MQECIIRSMRFLSVRSFSSHGKPHVHMPETAMLTNNGTHQFKRKGWEYSAYMGILGGPILLFLGLMNAPETDSDVFAREEVLAKRKGIELLARRPTGPISQRDALKSSDIGASPMLIHKE